ncbi:MAG: T9SS type A sorting domain-containing protein [Bacteroidales bacterium]|nr:T9SS type A sorting domain-containing protein [Bacteroidales bacterium]
MKKSILLSFIILLSVHLNAQVWIDSGAKWSYDYWNVSEGGTYTFTYTNDTLILGKQCQEIEIVRYQYVYDQFGEIHCIVDPMQSKFTYSSGDSVFYLRDDTFYLMYDFSASVGDTWVVGVDQFDSCEDTAVVRVAQTGSVVINGFQLRTITLETISNSFIGLTGTCVERFGNEIHNYPENSFGPFPGIQNCGSAVIDYNVYDFRCFTDNTFGTYNPRNIACDTLTGLYETETSGFGFYPNPTEGEIIIEKIDQSQIEIQIYSLGGQRVKQFYLKPTERKIDISGLQDGVYFIRIITDKGNAFRKVVKI